MSLVEPGMKYYVNETLKNCHSFKEQYHNKIINISLGIGLIIILLCVVVASFVVSKHLFYLFACFYYFTQCYRASIIKSYQLLLRTKISLQDYNYY
jgi:hypothetical protein